MTNPTLSLQTELLASVNQILEDAGLPPAGRFDPNLRLREDLGLDSLKLAILTVRLEDRFGVDVFSRGLVSTLGEVAARLPQPTE